MENYLPIFVVLFLACFFVGLRLFRNIWNPICLFCGLYALVLFLYSFHIFDLYVASDLALAIVVIGVLCFFGGALFCYKRSRKRDFLKRLSNQWDFSAINFKLLHFFNGITFLFLSYYVVVTIKLLMSGYSFAYIRATYLSDEATSTISSGIMSYIFSFFVQPWTYVIIPLSVIIFLLAKEKTKDMKLFLVMTIVNIAFFITVTAGRISLVYYLMYFIISIISTKRQKMSLKMKAIIAAFAIAGFAAISYISASRGSRPLIENAYLYVCGCIPFLSYRLELFITESNVFTLGLASLKGFLMVPIILLSKVFGGYPEIWLEATNNSYAEMRAAISPSVTYNAFTTPFYFFYIDGGIIGVVLLSAIYGFIAMKMYIKLQNDSSLKNLMLYLLIVHGLLFSMVRFQFNTFRYAGAFIYILLCFYKAGHIRAFCKRFFQKNAD